MIGLWIEPEDKAGGAYMIHIWVVPECEVRFPPTTLTRRARQRLVRLMGMTTTPEALEAEGCRSRTDGTPIRYARGGPGELNDPWEKKGVETRTQEGPR